MDATRRGTAALPFPGKRESSLLNNFREADKTALELLSRCVGQFICLDSRFPGNGGCFKVSVMNYVKLNKHGRYRLKCAELMYSRGQPLPVLSWSVDMVRIMVALCMFAMPLSAGAASLAERFTPGMPYYYEYFDPGQRPWKPGQPLNIEEVFKNYQYYEIEFDQDGKGITVNYFIKGNKAGSEKYLILPDVSLRKDER